MTRGVLRQVLPILLGLLIGLIPSTAAASPPDTPLFRWHHPISSSSSQAQRNFDQGLLFAYGFNHAAALESFQAAAQADPACAICYWGIAYALSFNTNPEIDPEDSPSARAAIQKANRLSDRASPLERAYIQALTACYSAEATDDRAALNLAYTNALRQVVQQYPSDPDAAVLLAEALMGMSPWKYWQQDGTLSSPGEEALFQLESVLRQHPQHPGALHFYIHLVEERHPEWAIAAADRLRDLHLPLGHLAHMPSHIYGRVGRYEDAIAANQQAIALDQEYAIGHPHRGVYTFAYTPHNQHFLWFAATLAGQEALAIAAAEQTAAMVDPDLVDQPGYGTLQHYEALPLYTRVQFSRWDEILAEAAPPAGKLYLTGIWHYARGMAFVGKGQLLDAAHELQRLRTIAADPVLENVTLWNINATADLLKIAAEVLAGENAAKQGQFKSAIAFLTNAVQIENHLRYDEPAPWHASTRRSLAAVLLQANQPEAAAQMYREDLARYPNNRWALDGLATSLRMQSQLKNRDSR